MKFLVHQENARKKTFLLVLLYSALLAGFSLLAAYGIDYIWDIVSSESVYYTTTGRFRRPPSHEPSYERFILLALLIPSVVGLATIFAPVSLKAGGKSVAEALEGVLVPPQTANFNERRLLNVVEEMALASGVPVPPVYVLQNEAGINAFAAGGTINDAVVGVTRGAMELLDRDELQAVIAHEFSHILNGDMNLNLRFAKLLFGLMCLAQLGRIAISLFGQPSSDKNEEGKGKGLILAIAIVCWISGLFLSFIGTIIQAAINRQREFLADASAVQFTRSPALARALKKIGRLDEGSELTATAMAESYSHFFFCKAQSSLFSTHPSLTTRILRIDPDWNGILATSAPGSAAAPMPTPGQSKEQTMLHSWGNLASNPPSVDVGQAVACAVPPAGGHPAGGHPSALQQIHTVAELELIEKTVTDNTHPSTAAPLPKTGDEAVRKLYAACREPLDACYLILSLLLDEKKNVQEKQLRACNDPKVNEAVLEYKQTLSLVSPTLYVPLIETAIPALKNLSFPQYEAFQQLMQQFIHADEIFSFQEWILHQLVTSQVGAQFRVKTARPPAVAQAKNASVSLLAALARLEKDTLKAQSAFDMGLKTMGLPQRPLEPEKSSSALSADIAVLAASTGPVQELFLKGAVAVAMRDACISLNERMFLRMLSLCLGRPVVLED